MCIYIYAIHTVNNKQFKTVVCAHGSPLQPLVHDHLQLCTHIRMLYNCVNIHLCFQEALLKPPAESSHEASLLPANTSPATAAAAVDCTHTTEQEDSVLWQGLPLSVKKLDCSDIATRQEGEACQHVDVHQTTKHAPIVVLHVRSGVWKILPALVHSIFTSSVGFTDEGACRDLVMQQQQPMAKLVAVFRKHRLAAALNNWRCDTSQTLSMVIVLYS